MANYKVPNTRKNKSFRLPKYNDIVNSWKADGKDLSDWEIKGFKFGGWSTDPNATVATYNDGDTVTLADDTILYIKWDAMLFDIEFLSNDGTFTTIDGSKNLISMLVSDVLGGTVLSVDGDFPTDVKHPTSTYQFKGWYDNNDVPVEVTYNVADNAYIIPWWKNSTASDSELINITFEIYDDATSKKIFKNFVVLKENFKTTTYYDVYKVMDACDEVITWYSDENYDNDSLINLDTTLASKLITHVYGKLDKAYTILFNLRDGHFNSELDSVKYAIYGRKIGLLPTPVRDSYRFDGWLDENDVKITEDTIFNVKHNVMYYASWTINSHTVSFNLNGGDGSIDDIVIDNNSKIGSKLPVDPSRLGYSFAGWYTAATGGTAINADTVVTDDVVAYAHWTINLYTITIHYLNGAADSTITKKYGEKLGTLADPTRTYYTFKQWNSLSDGSGTVVTSELPIYNETHIYAIWTYIASQNVSTQVLVANIGVPSKIFSDTTYNVLESIASCPDNTRTVSSVNCRFTIHSNSTSTHQPTLCVIYELADGTVQVMNINNLQLAANGTTTLSYTYNGNINRIVGGYTTTLDYLDLTKSSVLYTFNYA